MGVRVIGLEHIYYPCVRRKGKDTKYRQVMEI
jgi:hypothetical protein